MGKIKTEPSVQSSVPIDLASNSQTKKRMRNAGAPTLPHPGPFVLSEDWHSDEKAYAEALYYLLRKCKRLVVIVGAGISVQAGIPDFRSASGLFKSVKDEFKLKGSGQSMFDSSVYKDDSTTSIFHSMVNSLHTLSKDAPGTSFHKLLSQISVEKRLLRLYTQNVDCIELSLTGLETVVPLPAKPPWPKTIQLHGGLQNMVCAKCGWMAPFDPSVFLKAEVPDCKECKEMDSVREVVGKRTQGVGKMRPRIVLYNEFNPDGEAIGSVTAADLNARPDGLLVVGTSLRVPGVRRIVKEMSHSVHAAGGIVAWVNEDDPPALKMLEDCFDLLLKGDCQTIPLVLERWEKSNACSESQRRKRPSKRKAETIEVNRSQRVKLESAGSIKDVFKVKKSTSLVVQPAKSIK